MRPKRSRPNKDQEGDMYMSVHADDVPPESYSRPRSSYHLSENYRGPSSSSQESYVSGRDVSSRRSRGDDWRHRDLDRDRYPYNDGFPRTERSEYDDSGSRNSSGWVPVHSSQYGQSSLDWTHPFDSAASSSSSYPKATTWGITPPTPYDHTRSSFHERWPPAESREMPLDEWPAESSRVEHPPERRHPDWRPETRRDKNMSAPKFQSDSGWDSRRRDRSNWSNEPIGAHDDLHVENRHHTTEDRAWEPAASWKSTSRNEHQHQRSQNGQRSNPSKTKRGQGQTRRREWRAADDSDLNK